MNGWHAVSGFLVPLPGFVAAMRSAWSAAFCLGAAGSLIATAVWALADTYPLGGLLYFPNGGADALLRLGTSAIFVAGVANYFIAAMPSAWGQAPERRHDKRREGEEHASDKPAAERRSQRQRVQRPVHQAATAGRSQTPVAAASRA
jgi:hypothetical protein